MDTERRTLTAPVEVRTDAETPATLAGYAALFDTPTEIAGLFQERIAPGAFADAVTRDDVRALFNHDANYVLGRNTSGTLTLREDARGLRYEITPPDTQWARDLIVSVQRGDISQSSFAFAVDEESWDYPRGAMPVRTITRARLYDVSPVTYPAYESTTVSARSRAAAQRADGHWHVELELARERCRLIDASTR